MRAAPAFPASEPPLWGWLRRLLDARRLRQAIRAETARRRERTRRWGAGEPICTRCGGPLGVAPVRISGGTWGGKSIEVVLVCDACQGSAPVVRVDWVRCVKCGRKDLDRRITAPVNLSPEDLYSFGRLIAGVCSACEREARR